jgi:TrmH family RNA methyltransferase
VWVALDRVRDPGNLGTIIRTCDAFGASGVILVGECTDPFALEAVRATMGSIFHVPIVKMSMGDFLNWRDQFKGKLIGTHLEGSVDHRTLDYKGEPLCLLMGNEQQGLPAELSFTCDHLVRIAMSGQADSLNLAVATAIMVQSMRQHVLSLNLE